MTDKAEIKNVARADAPMEHAVLVSDSAIAMSSPRVRDTDLAAKISARVDEPNKAVASLDAGSKFELVGTGSDKITKAQALNPEEIQKGIKALVGDAKSGEKWSQDSIDTFRKIFDEQSKLPNASPESVARGLNGIGAAINRRVDGELAQDPNRRADPIGMAVMQNPDGSYDYYMTLNKTDKDLAANNADIASGRSNDKVIKLGSFKPGAPI